jgi:putative transposase
MNTHATSPHTETKIFQFYPQDRVEYKSIVYDWLNEVREGHYFQRSGESGPAEFFSHSELTRLFSLRREPMGYLPRKRSAPLAPPSEPLSMLKPEERRDVMFRLNYCKRFLALKLKDRRTSTDDEPLRESIRNEIDRESRNRHHSQGKNIKTYTSVPTYPSGRTLRRWLEKYTAAHYDPAAFVRKTTDQTGRADHFPPEICELIQEHLRIYASMDAPEQIVVHQMLEGAVERLNHVRRRKAELEGRKKPTDFTGPCLDTFRRRIHRLPDAYIRRGRHGEDIATKEFKALNGGLDIVAPLEQIQIDEARLDLRTLLEISSCYSSLTEEEKEVVAIVRLWITAAIDVATRKILGLRIHHSAPSSASAIATLEMVTRDKSPLARHLDCESDWSEHGNLAGVSSDSATWLTADDVHAVIIDAGGDVFHPQAGVPGARGAIERWMRTQSRQSLVFWSGRTWGSPAERGDRNQEVKLCYDQASALLYRYLIDVYPNQPHFALLDECPNDAWRRLQKMFKPTPPLSPDLRRHIFGQKAPRIISRGGVVFLGIRYSSEAMQQLFRHKEDTEVEIRVDRFDLGKISVYHDKGWLSVRSVHPEFAGMSVWMWMAFNRRLKLLNRERGEVPRAIALRTKEWLRNQVMVKNAEAELGTSVLDDEQYRKWEKKLAYEVDIVDDGTPFNDDADDLDEIESLLADLDDVETTIAALNAKTPKAKTSAKSAKPSQPVETEEEPGGSLITPLYNR